MHDASRSRRVTFAAHTVQVPRLLAAGARTLVNGAVLGALSELELAALDLRHYDAASLYRTAGWNERGLFDWEQQVLDDHFGSCRRVVVLAAGGGREVLALLGRGIDAVGYEPNASIATFGAELLASHGYEGRLRPSGRDEIPPEAGRCDGVVVGWGAYSLVIGRARRVELLGAIRSHLADGGPVLVSYVERQPLDRELRWTAAVANALRVVRRAERVELGDTLAPSAVHLFDRAEVADELATAGFGVVAHLAIAGLDESSRYGCAVGVRR